MAAKEGFVPELQLNSHVTEQLKALNQCDTITVDPHKSGFCPYPAGAICYRNQDLNNFLSLTSDVVYYHGNINIGDLGLEGSKPGAAAAGVLLANRVSSRKMSSLLAQQEKNILKKSIALKLYYISQTENSACESRVKSCFLVELAYLLSSGCFPLYNYTTTKLWKYYVFFLHNVLLIEQKFAKKNFSQQEICFRGSTSALWQNSLLRNF